MAPPDNILFTRKHLKRSAMSGSHASSASTVLEPNTKKPRLGNARFDSMIETMSAYAHLQPTVSGQTIMSGKETQSKRRGARTQPDRYSPPISSDLGHELSFIKMAPKRRPNELDSASSPSTVSKAESSASKPRFTCNPLPSWLTNTFMSLAKKHPLRLLLPSNLRRPDTPRKPFEEITDWLSPEEQSMEFVHVDDHTFAFAAQDTGHEENSSHTVSNLHEDAINLDVDYDHHFPSDTLPNAQEWPRHPSTPTVFAQPIHTYSASSVPAFPAPLLLDPVASFPKGHPSDRYLADIGTCSSPTLHYTDFPADLICDNGLKPFSTPGPASTIGSATVTDPLDSSRTYMSMQDKLERVHNPQKDNDNIQSNTDKIGSHENDSKETTQQSLLDLVEDPLLSRLYSTPGPRYYAPAAVHFDSPTEDPLSSDSSTIGFEINHTELDFRWTRFDRKGLTASSTSARPLFVPEMAQEQVVPHTPLNYAQRQQSVASLPINSQFLPVSPRSSSSPAPVSPTPFRFAPPSQKISLSQGRGSQKSKVSVDYDHDRGMDVQAGPTGTPPAKLPFTVPGVYISPLANSRIQTPINVGSEDDLPSVKIASKALRKQIESKNTNYFNNVQNVRIATGTYEENDLYSASQRTSASDDSIESWSAVSSQR